MVRVERAQQVERPRGHTGGHLDLLPLNGRQVSSRSAPWSSVGGVETQADISREIEDLRGTGGPQPRRDYPPYRSSVRRYPTRDLHQVDPEGVELWAPCFGAADIDDAESDLTIQRSAAPLGERITVTGRVVDGQGRPARRQLVELWQANASGRYWHQRDQHPAPLDPNFIGAGRCLTD